MDRAQPGLPVPVAMPIEVGRAVRRAFVAIGAPRTITDDQVEAVIATTWEETPPHATHWSTRSMARNVSLSQTAVTRVWRAFGLQPHRTESFKLSTDPLFVDKVRDAVGLYLDPPERAVVCSVDEKTQI